jgi:hypothetical protein
LKVHPKNKAAGDIGLLVDYVRVLLAIATLFCGQFLPESRLLLQGIPLNTIVFIFSISFILGIPENNIVFSKVFLSFCPIFFMAIPLFWTDNYDYGMQKLCNLGVSSFVAVILMMQTECRRGIEWILRVWLRIIVFLLFLALLYKLFFGFFNRAVPFFLNGPIIFARFMGVAAIISLLVVDGFKKWVLYFIFMLAVLWTCSKGPLLSLFIVTLLYMNRRIGFFSVVFIALLSLFTISILFQHNNFVRQAVMNNRYGAAILFVIDPDKNASGNYGSIGIRNAMYKQTVDVIDSNPFGIGMGNWKRAVVEPFGLEYPHNFFLELISECGWIIGLLAVVPFIIFFIRWNSSYFLIPLFFLMAQQVSGDLLDARYLLSFSLLIFFSSQGRGDTNLEGKKHGTIPAFSA